MLEEVNESYFIEVEIFSLVGVWAGDKTETIRLMSYKEFGDLRVRWHYWK